MSHLKTSDILQQIKSYNMEIDADLILLKKDLNNTMKDIREKKENDKSKTTIVATYGGLVSALTTVLIGLSSYISNYATYFSIAALVTSASLTVVQAWDRLFNHKRLWII